MSFLALPDEIVAVIVSLCSVHDVVRLGMVRVLVLLRHSLEDSKHGADVPALPGYL